MILDAIFKLFSFIFKIIKFVFRLIYNLALALFAAGALYFTINRLAFFFILIYNIFSDEKLQLINPERNETILIICAVIGVLAFLLFCFSGSDEKASTDSVEESIEENTSEGDYV